MTHDENEIRTAAQSIYENLGTMNSRAPQSPLDITRSHSINLITEEFLGGYTQDGRMSVVRRFFCLFVTFDLFFISLLWLICIMITGDNIYNALKTQVVHYTIYTSLFDVVMAAVCRFVVLLLFYALLYVNHWFIIACSTSGSCLFLISKVFVYDWIKTPEPVFQVVLIVTSFVLAWGEAWFLDCRVIPQERHARNYFYAITSNNHAVADRSPLIAPFLASEGGPPTESHLTFYSPYDSRHDSDEEDEQDEEYKKMGKECVRKAYELLETTGWKIEKVTSKGDRIQSMQKDKLGKIYRLTAIIKYPAKLLLQELFYKIEDVPKWNPTLLESKIVRKIDTRTDITYQATVGGGGGFVQSRDFVNLRCWRLCRNGQVVDTDDEEDDEENTNCDSYAPSTAEGSVSTLSDEECLIPNEYINGVSRINSDDKRGRACNLPSPGVSKSIGENRLKAGHISNSDISKGTQNPGVFNSLSKSLGAKDFRTNFNVEPPPLDDEFTDASDNPDLLAHINNEKIYISAAISVNYPGVQNNSKYVRGENLVSCWAMRETPGKSDTCIFEWLLCLDLKGYIPRYVLDAAYTSLMQDYMTYLRKYVKELRHRKRKVPDRGYS